MSEKGISTRMKATLENFSQRLKEKTDEWWNNFQQNNISEDFIICAKPKYKNNINLLKIDLEKIEYDDLLNCFKDANPEYDWEKNQGNIIAPKLIEIQDTWKSYE